jgi:hypothetical protein
LQDIENLAELRIADCGIGVAESGPIKDVESVATRLDVFSFAEPESFEEAHVLE